MTRCTPSERALPQPRNRPRAGWYLPIWGNGTLRGETRDLADHHAPAGHVHRRHDVLERRDEHLLLWRARDPDVVGHTDDDLTDRAERAAVLGHHLAADELVRPERIRRRGRNVGRIDEQVLLVQRLRRRAAADLGELHE